MCILAGPQRNPCRAANGSSTVVALEKGTFIDEMFVNERHIIQGPQFDILIVSQDKDDVWLLLETTERVLIDYCYNSRESC